MSEPALVHPMILQMKPGAIPVRCAATRYTPEQSLWLHNHVQMLLEQGLIYRNHDSRWSSPAIVVR